MDTSVVDKKDKNRQKRGYQTENKYSKKPQIYTHANFYHFIEGASLIFLISTLLTLSQRCDTVENVSCADVCLRCCDNVALRRYQDVATMLLQRRHNIYHWISRPFYYKLF